MTELVTARAALGDHRMRAAAKEEVIAYLAACDVAGGRRRRWYREWCRATASKCHQADLDRVAPSARRRTEVQLGLLP